MAKKATKKPPSRKSELQKAQSLQKQYTDGLPTAERGSLLAVGLAVYLAQTTYKANGKSILDKKSLDIPSKAEMELDPRAIYEATKPLIAVIAKYLDTLENTVQTYNHAQLVTDLIQLLKSGQGSVSTNLIKLLNVGAADANISYTRVSFLDMPDEYKELPPNGY